MNEKKILSQPQIVIIIAILVFFALSILFHLVTIWISGKMPAVPAQAEKDSSAAIAEVQPSAEYYSPMVDAAVSYGSDTVSVSSEASEDLSTPSALYITPQNLPSFDFGSMWVNDNGTQAVVSTGDATATLYFLSGKDAASLETAMDGKIAECEDYNIPYTVSEVENEDAASVQAINTVTGNYLITDIYLSTSNALLNFTLDRTSDVDGRIYTEIRTYLQQNFRLTLPEAAPISVPDPPKDKSESVIAPQPDVDHISNEYDEPIIVR